ncbi:unnamed protein product [Hymenolepis diminuta]|uniref:Uncharacterized protein n=1 Tax=Hymenolepis diminuta TaxID=6216 RepID=A0A564Y0S0_HYMDI|nr:unnamed protein product [Hymenolepis diminuta]
MEICWFFVQEVAVTALGSYDAKLSVMSKPVYRFLCSHSACQTPLLRCLLIAFVPYLSLTQLNLHCDLINTFWPSQILVLCSVTVVHVVSCQPLVVTPTPTNSNDLC